MRLLDLFCGAGGAAVGYSRAGFTEIVGVDIKPQPRYPFTFVQGDALKYVAAHGRGFDVIHASPPCQAFSTMTMKWGRAAQHPDLVAATRAALNQTSLPWVMENVLRAPMRRDVVLCGSMFGLGANGGHLLRHRAFECSWPVSALPPPCKHDLGRTIAVYGHAGGSSKRDGLTFGGTDEWREAMGIYWMTGNELSQAIPPAYTEWIGRQLLAQMAPTL